MLQRGTLYSIVNNESSIESKEPIPNVYIYFSQNNVRKLTTKTDAQGKFSFDLPLGSYQVTVSQGATSQVYQLAGGAPFELTSASKQSAFEEWVLAPIYLKPEENPLVVLMNNLVLDARKSATEAKAEADRAEQTVGDSVGSGKLMREGAGGVLVADRVEFFDFNAGLEIYNSGFQHRYIAATAKNRPTNSVGILESSFDNTMYDGYRKYTTGRGDILINPLSKGLFNKNWFELYSTKNTMVDSNGFIKSASPIVRLFDDRIETNDQFKEEPQFRKIDTGIYQVFNTLGLAKEGWTVETPKDKHGKPYFHVIVQKTYDGAIISVHDEYDVRRKKKIKDIFGEEQEVEVVEKILGEARDIKPHERWIDLRFHEEPEDIRDIDEIVELEEEQSDLEKHLEENNAVLL